MSRTVTFKQLQKTLGELGFVQYRKTGGHVLFWHSETGAVLTLPMTESVRPIYVSSAARQIANSGIAASSAFEKKLGKSAKGGG